MKSKAKKPNYLLFVDTNILLDFYRARTDAGMKLLRRLEGLTANLICTYQVEMEFKKNRQKVIIDSMKSIGQVPNLQVPSFLIDHRAAKSMKRSLKEGQKHTGKLQAKLKRALEKPALHDDVYKVVQRLFRNTSEYNLTREMTIRQSIRRLAFKRFILGYPPRKINDSSIGDSFNWEWIVSCGKLSTSNIILVTRDSDYGHNYGDSQYVNDWLQEEIRDRVSKKRRLILLSRLSDALKYFDITVSGEEKEEELNLLKRRSHWGLKRNLRELSDEQLTAELTEALNQILKASYEKTGETTE